MLSRVRTLTSLIAAGVSWLHAARVIKGRPFEVGFKCEEKSTERSTPMNIKYVGMDIHKEAVVIAVMNGEGKVVMESIIETKASTILQCIQGIHGDLHVTLEEGTWSAWLYDLLKPHVTELVVCDPRKNALLKEGNKSDKIDARKLADLLRGGYLRSVYHGENGLRTLKELARSYLTISQDLTRAVNRVKALSWRGTQCVRAPPTAAQLFTSGAPL